jgi:hypothetical protein
MCLKWLILLIVVIFLFILYLSPQINPLYEHLIIDPAPRPDVGIPLGNLNITSFDFQNRLTPIRLPMTDIVPFPYLNGKPYVDPNSILNINEWKELVSQMNMKIPHTYKETYSKNDVNALGTNCYKNILRTGDKTNVVLTDYGFVENCGTQYNYFFKTEKSSVDLDWINRIKKEVLDDLGNIFKDKSFKLPQCKSEYNPCLLEEVDWRIIKLGSNPTTGNKIIEGQILFGVKERPLLLLLRYIASDENEYTLYTAYLDGIIDRSAREYENQYKPYTPYMEYNPNPMLKKEKYDVSMGTPSFIPDKKKTEKIVDNMLDKFYEMNEPRCFGKMAMTKNECEAVYDPAGNPNKVVGVWDKECRKNEDCPFYKANKNYPNEFGGCIQGQCQMPQGIQQISPLKYRNENKAYCYGCKDGGLKCCEAQKDRNEYSNLKSPDYKFEGDELLREKYYYMLSR